MDNTIGTGPAPAAPDTTAPTSPAPWAPAQPVPGTAATETNPFAPPPASGGVPASPDGYLLHENPRHWRRGSSCSIRCRGDDFISASDTRSFMFDQ
jgi:hypothetical protein